LTASNGTNVEISGAAKVKLKVDELLLSTAGVVSPDVDQLILGLDWLCLHGVEWKHGADFVCIRGTKVALYSGVELKRNTETMQPSEMESAPSEVEVAGIKVMISPVERRAEAARGSQEARVSSKVEAYAGAEGRTLAALGTPSSVVQMREREMMTAVRQSLKRRTGQGVEQSSAAPPHWQNKRENRRGCFHCGSWRHRIRYCPRRQQERQVDERGEVTSTRMGATETANPETEGVDSMSSDELFEGISIPETPPWMLGKATGIGCARDEARGGSPDSATSM